jgi:hypothetical protein
MNETNTPDTIGNQFGYLCPECSKGDDLRVVASVSVKLMSDGTDNTDSDTEWDDASSACCGCGWGGHVKDFKQAENFEDE